jgi:hypothetical protein
MALASITALMYMYRDEFGCVLKYVMTGVLMTDDTTKEWGNVYKMLNNIVKQLDFNRNKGNNVGISVLSM